MSEKNYTISEAAAKVEVETHVLRYWEEELEINIRRNDMGHRCYEEKDIKILQRVKMLKDKGIQLKAIKDVVHRMYELIDGDGAETAEKEKAADMSDILSCETDNNINTFDTIRVNYADDNEESDDQNSRIVDFKMAQFQNIMDKIISNSIRDNLKIITQSVSAAVSDDVIKQMDMIIQEKEEQEEARYRKLDAVIREIQQSKREIAAADVKEKKKRLFRRKQRQSL